MLKRIFLGLAIAAGLLSPAYSAGTLPGFSVSQQMDKFGKPLAGCHLYIIQAGTTSTPQNAYFDSGLTLPTPNPLICDAAGRISQFFLADGSIKIRLTDVNGVQQLTADGLLVVGPSGGGGGGGSVDPTTIIATGDVKARYGTGVLSGFVRLNGRTIGSATSGATERANADTDPLFEYLWNTDPNLAVSGGRGGSAAADFAANKTITLPDARGRSIFGLDDMGNAAAGNLTATYFGTAATVLGAIGGSQSHTLTATESASLAYSTAFTVLPNQYGPTTILTNVASTSGISVWASPSSTATQQAIATGGTLQTTSNAGGNPHSIVSPGILMTVYMKL